MPNRSHLWAAAHAPWFLAATAGLTLLALAQLVDFENGALRLDIDPSLESISTESKAEREYRETLRLRFASTEAILVVMEVDDVFTTEALTRLEHLTRRLAALEGVESATSLATTPLPYRSDGTLRFLRASGKALEDPALPELLRRAAADNPLVRGQLVAADGRAATVLLRHDAEAERALLRSDLSGRVLRAADAERAAGVRIYVTGPPIIRSAISESVTRQLRYFVPAAIVLLTVLLALAFPTRRGVLLPIATIVIALLWTLATLSALGRPLNLITSLVPPLVVTMALAYCAHVLSEFEALAAEHETADPKMRVAALLKEVSVPVSVTASTTIAGFLALLLNAQSAMTELAWLSAVATFYLLVLALGFMPAALRYARPPGEGRPLVAGWLFDAASQRLSEFDQRKRPVILSLAGAAFVAALFFASRIQVGDSFVGIFPATARVRTDYNAVNVLLGGVNPLEIAIDGEADRFTDPTVLRALDELERWLRAQPEVGAVSGLADHVVVLNASFGGQPGTIPESRDAVRQMLFVGDSELLRGVVNSDRSSTLIRARLTADDTGRIAALLDRLQGRLDALPSGVTPHVSGSAAVLAESVRTTTSGQMQSVALALVLIFVCLSVQFLSLRIGLLASLPTVLQTSLYFGALGLLAVPLNPTTTLVECLVLGLAIDDTIHYLSRFNSAAKRSGSEAIAAASSLKAVLRPITLTKAILAIGFLTMVAGELANQARFGWLAALTLGCAWLVDVFVTPAFMSGLRIVTLWDTLRLNLGSDVQGSIPLFSGLTNRQARIFALMANLHRVPAGTRLITQGEAPGSVYVVVDGELRVWVGHNGSETELARLGRGAVVGEHGYFGQPRNANVDALRETRLLRFDQTDQERLCDAYPAIAARVFLSLNRLQAERQAKRP